MDAQEHSLTTLHAVVVVSLGLRRGQVHVEMFSTGNHSPAINPSEEEGQRRRRRRGGGREDVKEEGVTDS